MKHEGHRARPLGGLRREVGVYAGTEIVTTARFEVITPKVPRGLRHRLAPYPLRLQCRTIDYQALLP
jgi:hypothetical protein